MYQSQPGEWRVDLHIHSSASDGTWTPESLIKKSTELGIKIIAVTDHDSIENISKTKELAKKNNIFLLNGIEISALLHGEIYHILGYGFKLNNKELHTLIQTHKKLIEQRDYGAINSLVHKGYKLDINEYKKYEYDLYRGGWKLLNYFIDKGVCSDGFDYFDRIFTSEISMSPIKFLSPREVIEIIHRAGGRAVLAHPGSYKKCNEVNKIISEFIEYGIDGVECFHPHNNLETTKRCIDWCKKNSLIISGGSDCHGNLVDRQLGIPEICLNNLELSDLIQKMRV